MTHNTNQNSIAALLKPSTQTSTEKLAQRILDALHGGSFTRQELAKQFGKDVGSLCGAVKTLLTAELIVEQDRVKNKDTGSWNWKLALKSDV